MGVRALAEHCSERALDLHRGHKVGAAQEEGVANFDGRAILQVEVFRRGDLAKSNSKNEI